MFEAVWDEAVDGPEPVPSDPEPPERWQTCPVEELAAGDPERPRSVSEILAVAESGSIDAALQVELAVIDVETLDEDERIAVAAAADRCVNHYEGVKLRAIGAFAGPVPRDDVCEGAFAWTEIGPALRLGEGQARRVVHAARRLRTHLRGTLSAMLAGDVSLGKAHSLVDGTVLLDEDGCREVEERVLPHAAGRNPGNHTAAVGRAVRKVDPDGWRQRREQRLRDCAMIRMTQGDGVVDMVLRSLDPVQSEQLWTAADTWARNRKAAGDERALDALRVAAIIDWCSRYMTGTPIQPDGVPFAEGDMHQPPTRHAQPVVVNVLISLPDLIDPANGGAATVAGSGEPLPAEAVAELLRDGARIRFALVDAGGNLTGISAKVHDPTALMRVFVALRDVTLRVPGGSATVVAGQDLDHIDPDGPTEPANLHPPSRGWHRAKTFSHWALTPNRDGSITWSSRRTGRTYTTYPFNHRDGP